MLFSIKMLIHSLQKRSFITPILEKELLENVKLTPISLFPITVKFLEIFIFNIPSSLFNLF